MTRARRMMEENLSAVDALCEVLDARIPAASRNPEIDVLASGKPRLIVLNRADLADSKQTDHWTHYYEEKGFSVLVCDSQSGKGTAAFGPAMRKLMRQQMETWEKKGLVGRKLRIMVVGIPNVGKSTFINKIAGRKAAQASDRPGVTRGRQWIAVDRTMELLDTPGILWPKFEDPEVGELLAVTNAIKSEVVDREALAAKFLLRLCSLYPEAVRDRYRLTAQPEENGYDLLDRAARSRGFLLRGAEADTERMANTLLTEYHTGKLGRLTLEVPPKSAPGNLVE